MLMFLSGCAWWLGGMAGIGRRVCLYVGLSWEIVVRGEDR